MKQIFFLTLLITLTFTSYSQNPSGDCVGAIPVCKNVYNSPNPYLYSGEGFIYPEIDGIGLVSPEFMDCITLETDGVWYLFTIQESGNLRFTVNPNNDSDDYDWIVFDLTDRRCEDIYKYTKQYMISSNDFGDEDNIIVETGANSLISGGNAGNCNGPGDFNGPPYNDDIPVKKGGTYVLYLSNWSQSTSGFDIDFSASTAKLFDDVKPELYEMYGHTECNDNEIEVHFTEQIICNNITNNDFTVISPSGNILSIQSITSACSTSVGADKSNYFKLRLASPISETGKYTVKFVGNTSDACGNSVDKNTELIFNVNLYIHIWGDNILCENETGILHTSGEFDSYLWNTGETEKEITINKPGKYNVIVTKGACSVTDFHEVKSGIVDFTIGNDTVFCENEKIIIGTDFEADKYTWNNNETTNKITVDTSGKYILKLEKDGCQASDTVILTAKEIPYPDLGEDMYFCINDSVITSLKKDYESYLWNTGDISKNIKVFKTGEYILKVLQNGCFNNDTILIEELDLNFNLGNDTTIICSNVYKVLDPKIYDASYKWNTGDTSRTITVNEERIFILNIEKSICKSTDTITIEVKEAPTVYLGNDTLICLQDTAFYDAGAGNESYLWNTGNTEQSIKISEPGEYIVTVFKNTCQESDTVNVTRPKLDINIGEDINKCEGDTVNLSANFDADKYFWNTAETTKSISVHETGNYFLKITNTGCTNSDTLYVEFTPYPELDIQNFYQACLGATIHLEPVTDADYYYWNKDNTEAYLEFIENDTVNITAGIGNCKITREIELYFEECEPKFIIPNVFTPNGDGRNDYFTIKTEDVFEYKIEIFNRWGQKVYVSYELDKGWDGNANEKKQNPDTYYFIITHKFGYLTGHLNLFR